MAESILNTTKASLGLPAGHDAFDTELIMHVNSVLSRLTSLGVGPAGGFRITGEQETWEQVLGDPDTDEKALKLNNAKSLMFYQTKLAFDPPDIGFRLTMMKEEIQKLEWLLNVTVDDSLVDDDVVDDLVDVVMDGGTP